jgi:hypothetical protein
MSGHRKAALALHALTPEDQALILAGLPTADQRLLNTYLDELAELGFDARAVDTALSDRPSPAPRDRVAAAAADDILRVLGNEPLGLVRALLDAGPWQWESALLSAMPGPMRAHLQTGSTAERPAPAREAFILRAVAEALQASDAAIPTVSRARVPFLRNWIKSWYR